MPIDLTKAFPALSVHGFQKTSLPTPSYNCIAWAAGDVSRWWWPSPVSYWPAGVPNQEAVDAFQQAYATLGYSPCADGALEQGYEKVAIYSINGKPTHAARQLPDGLWTSKLGNQDDISHHLDGLSGGQYGQPTAFMRRPLIQVAP